MKRLEPMPSYAFVLGFVSVPSILSLPLIPHFSSWWTSIFIGNALYFSILLVSIVGYRLSPFHPLGKFPGPYIARVSKVWDVYITLQGKRHIYYQQLHEKYGDYVRVGMF